MDINDNNLHKVDQIVHKFSLMAVLLLFAEGLIYGTAPSEHSK
jgi:hypothetical protein